MGKWLDRLAAYASTDRPEKGVLSVLPKPTKAPFDGFDGTQTRGISTLGAPADVGSREKYAQRPQSNAGAVEPPPALDGLPAMVRARFRDACRQLNIDERLVMLQFDRWEYREANLREMLLWPDSTVEQHCRLLATEADEGIGP